MTLDMLITLKKFMIIRNNHGDGHGNSSKATKRRFMDLKSYWTRKKDQFRLVLWEGMA